MRLNKTKQTIIKLEDAESVDSIQFQICQKLKMTGWQFDDLAIEEKILKWKNRNPDKELVIQINKELILKKIREDKSRTILLFNSEIPKNYELGNHFNRRIHSDPISRTQEQVGEDENKIQVASEEEYDKIIKLLEGINSKCLIKIIE